MDLWTKAGRMATVAGSDTTSGRTDWTPKFDVIDLFIDPMHFWTTRGDGWDGIRELVKRVEAECPRSEPTT